MIHNINILKSYLVYGKALKESVSSLIRVSYYLRQTVQIKRQRECKLYRTSKAFYMRENYFLKVCNSNKMLISMPFFT